MAKRKKKETNTEVESKPVEASAAIEVAVMEEKPATVPVEPPVAETITQAEQPARSFAEQHEPKSKYPDPNKPFSLAHNNVAGVRLLKHDRFKQTQLQFTEKVSPELHSQLREGGWTYRPDEAVYTKQYGGRGEPLAILEAKRLYNRLVEQLTPETATQGREF